MAPLTIHLIDAIYLQVKEQKEGTSIKLQTLNDDNIEDIGQSSGRVPEEPVTKKPKKIKF